MFWLRLYELFGICPDIVINSQYYIPFQIMSKLVEKAKRYDN